jgi:hypothetical protein
MVIKQMKNDEQVEVQEYRKIEFTKAVLETMISLDKA